MIALGYARWIPAGLLVVLIGVRLVDGDFLATPVIKDQAWLAWLTWFFLIFTVLGYATAWVLAPGFVHVVTNLARRGLLPFALLLIVGLGVLAFGDMLWNALVKSWCEGCPDARMTMSVAGAITGGP